jgi:hypothetical protein
MEREAETMEPRARRKKIAQTSVCRDVTVSRPSSSEISS